MDKHLDHEERLVSGETNDSESIIASIKHSPVILSYGFLSKIKYEHKSKNCKIQSVTYNSKTREYVIVDSIGISAWNSSYTANKTSRLMDFPAHQFNVIKILLYCRPFNLYFALTKDYQLKIYNLNFHETFSIESDTNALIHMIFNAETDELVTASRSEIHIWKFGALSKQKDTAKASYGLILKSKWAIEHGRLINRLTLDEECQRLYCLSEADVWCYDLTGRFVFSIKKACSTHLSACAYAGSVHSVIAGSIDGQISILTSSGGKIHTFYSHSSLITEIMIHPSDDHLIMTSSLDGYIKVFSLDLLEELYSLKVFNEGIEYMALRSKELLYCVSTKEIEVFDLNYLCQFWGQLRYPAQRIELVRNSEKSSRVVVVDSDNSMKMFSVKDGRKLCTVLPPPTVDSSNKILDCIHDRDYNLVYILVTTSEIWVYTTKTNPACFLAPINLWQQETRNVVTSRKLSRTSSPEPDISKFTVNSDCNCIEVLQNFFETEFVDNNGVVQAKCNLLACGMENGDMLLYNPMMSGRKENTISLFKDPIVGLKYFREQPSCLVMTKGKEGLLINMLNSDLVVSVSVFCDNDIICYVLKDRTLAAGFTSGHVIVKELPDRNLGLVAMSKTSSIDHYSGVLSISFHPTLNIICSSGKDCCLKIWSLDKNLLSEINFDQSLRSACFLNSSGDIIMGFKGHIFIIRNVKQLGWLACKKDDKLDCSQSESEIYESPHIRYELKRPPSPVSDDMENYLVPYQDMMFSTIGTWIVNDDDNLSGFSDNEIEAFNDTLSTDESLAPSDIYQSSLYSMSSMGSKLWGLPACGRSPEGSVHVSDEEIDVPSEEGANEVTENIQEIEKPQVDSKSRLKELLATAEKKESPAVTKPQKFNHNASKKLKNTKINSKQLKTESVGKGVNVEKETAAAAVSGVSPSQETIIQENREKRKIVKKAKKKTNLRRRVVPEKSLSAKMDDDSPVNGKEETARKESSVEPKLLNDGGYSSPISKDFLQVSEEEKEQADEFGASLVKSRVKLLKSASRIDAIENTDRTEELQNSPIFPALQIRDEDFENGRPGVSTAQFESTCSSRSSIRSTAIAESLLETDKINPESPLQLNKVVPESPFEADQRLLNNISPAVEPPFYIEFEADENPAESTLQRAKKGLIAEYHGIKRSTSENTEETLFTERGTSRITESVHSSTLRARWYKNEPKLPSQDVVKTRVVPAFPPSMVEPLNSTQKKAATRSTQSPLAMLSMTSQKLKLGDNSTKHRRKSTVEEKSKAKNVAVARSVKKPKGKAPELRRQSSQAVRVPVGEMLENSRILLPSSIGIKNVSVKKQISIGKSDEGNPDDLLKFCLSALKRKSIDMAKRRALTMRVYSADRSFFKRANEENVQSEELGEDLRPKTAPDDTAHSAQTRSLEEPEFNDEHIDEVRRSNEIDEGFQSPSLESVRLSPFLGSEDPPEADEEGIDFKVTISRGNIYQREGRSKGQPTNTEISYFDGNQESMRQFESKSVHKSHVAKDQVDMFDFIKTGKDRQNNPQRYGEKSVTNQHTPISIYKKAKLSQLHKSINQERSESQNISDSSVWNKEFHRNSPGPISRVSSQDLHFGNDTQQAKTAKNRHESENAGVGGRARKTQEETKIYTHYENIAFDPQERGMNSDNSQRGLIFVNLHKENEVVNAFENGRESEFDFLLDAAELQRNVKPPESEQVKRVLRPQEKLLERKALSARLRKRQESAKFRRNVIEQQKRARSQNRNASPAYSPDYRSEFLMGAEQEMQACYIYEYNKPTPLVDHTKNASTGNKNRSLRARLSGKAFRYGKPVAHDENESVIVDFIRSSMNKKPDHVNLLPRPKSTPSIPARCQHYVLLTETEKQEQKPSKIEQEILRKRFSEFSLQVT